MKAILFLLAFALIAAPIYAGNGDLMVNGNLGLGTTPGGQRLTVVGNARLSGVLGLGLPGAASSASGINFSETILTANGQAQGVSLDAGLNLTATANNDILAGIRINPTFTLGAFSGVKTYGVYSMTPANNYFAGNVGIGTTAPSGQLELSSTTQNLTRIKLSGQEFYQPGNTSTDGIGFILGVNRSGNRQLWVTDTNLTVNSTYSALRVFPSVGAIDAISTDGTTYKQLALGNPAGVTMSGNIGIGTTSPSYPLHVVGTAYADGVAGALSDVRHKDSIQSLAISGLDTVARLRPVSFVWKEPKDDGMQGPQIGFIAQEVEQVLPQVVLTEPNDEQTKGLKYNELIPILTKAIQEQQAQIEALKGRVAALEAAR